MSAFSAFMQPRQQTAPAPSPRSGGNQSSGGGRFGGGAGRQQRGPAPGQPQPSFRDVHNSRDGGARGGSRPSRGDSRGGRPPPQQQQQHQGRGRGRDRGHRQTRAPSFSSQDAGGIFSGCGPGSATDSILSRSGNVRDQPPFTQPPLQRNRSASFGIPKPRGQQGVLSQSNSSLLGDAGPSRGSVFGQPPLLPSQPQPQPQQSADPRHFFSQGSVFGTAPPPPPPLLPRLAVPAGPARGPQGTGVGPTPFGLGTAPSPQPTAATASVPFGMGARVPAAFTPAIPRPQGGFVFGGPEAASTAAKPTSGSVFGQLASLSATGNTSSVFPSSVNASVGQTIARHDSGGDAASSAPSRDEGDNEDRSGSDGDDRYSHEEDGEDRLSDNAYSAGSEGGDREEQLHPGEDDGSRYGSDKGSGGGRRQDDEDDADNGSSGGRSGTRSDQGDDDGNEGDADMEEFSVDEEGDEYYGDDAFGSGQRSGSEEDDRDEGSQRHAGARASPPQQRRQDTQQGRPPPPPPQTGSAFSWPKSAVATGSTTAAVTAGTAFSAFGAPNAASAFASAFRGGAAASLSAPASNATASRSVTAPAMPSPAAGKRDRDGVDEGDAGHPSRRREETAHRFPASALRHGPPPVNANRLSIAGTLFRSFLGKLAEEQSRESAWQEMDVAFFGDTVVATGPTCLSVDFPHTLDEFMLVWNQERQRARALQSKDMRGEMWVVLFALGCQINLIMHALAAPPQDASTASASPLSAFIAGVQANVDDALTDACAFAKQMNDIAVEVYQHEAEMLTPYSILPTVFTRVRTTFEEANERGALRVVSNMRTVTSKIFSVLFRKLKTGVVEVLPSDMQAPQSSVPRWMLLCKTARDKHLVMTFACLVYEIRVAEAPHADDINYFVEAFHHYFPTALEERCKLYFSEAGQLLQQPLSLASLQVAADRLAKALATLPKDGVPTSASHGNAAAILGGNALRPGAPAAATATERRTAQFVAARNRMVIEIHLTAVNLALGRVPRSDAANELHVPELADAMVALRAANLVLFDVAMRNNGVFYIQTGIYNVMMAARERLSLLLVVKFYVAHGCQKRIDVPELVRFYGLAYSPEEAMMVWLLPLLIKKYINGLLDQQTLILSDADPFDGFAKQALLATAEQDYGAAAVLA